MKKFTTIFVLAVALAFTACNSDKKSEQEIDSLNQTSADSLLNAALEADTTLTDSVVVDSLAN
ncbi:hypothetical protein [Pedobacter alpinus]|uniref:Uncharacterized protein n=1 Tax=Pedobacter alpinus TaxID=1590643 RepID=A0ABW5TN72_9SPHI